MRPCALLRHNRHRTGRSRSGANQLQETKQPRAEERMGGDAMNACLSQSRSNALIPPRRRTWIIAEAHLGLPLLGGRRILVLRHHDPEALPGLPLLEGIRFLVLQPISWPQARCHRPWRSTPRTCSQFSTPCSLAEDKVLRTRHHNGD